MPLCDPENRKLGSCGHGHRSGWHHHRYWDVWSSPYDYHKAFISPAEDGKYRVGFYQKKTLAEVPDGWRELPVEVAMNWVKGYADLPEEYS